MMEAPSGNGEHANVHGPGVTAYTTRDRRWRISTRKLPILKAEPIEEFNQKLGIPIPEMIFGDNYVALEYLPTGWKLEFNAFDALDKVSKTSDGMLQVAYSKEWQRDRQHQEGIREVVKPFDWSYSTDYKGTTHAPEVASWSPSNAGKTPIRTDLLARPDPILFYDDVMLYEDELADNGITVMSCKIRVMPERLLLLCRFFLRLDGVVVRLRDTRVYVELSSKTVIRQYTAKEESYEKIQAQLAARRENVPEALRDANRVNPLLRIVEDTMDCFVVPD